MTTYKYPRQLSSYAHGNTDRQASHRPALAETKPAALAVELLDPVDDRRVVLPLGPVELGPDPDAPGLARLVPGRLARLDDPDLGVGLALWVVVLVRVLLEPRDEDVRMAQDLEARARDQGFGRHLWMVWCEGWL